MAVTENILGTAPGQAGGAVEQNDQPGQQEQQRDEQGEELVEQPACPVVARMPEVPRHVALALHEGISHQNACPSETLTANGPSPFWRFSGTPRSTLIGPKLE